MNGWDPEFSAIRKQSRRSAADRVGIGKPMVQTQVLGLQDIPINLVFSKRLCTPSDLRRVTVVDSVAVRSSRFNAVQRLEGNPGLKIQDLPREVQVENLVPNQILAFIEVC
jgi:hypothetical protein